MATVKVQWRGLQEARKLLAPQRLRRVADDVLVVLAAKALEKVKEYTPRDTRPDAGGPDLDGQHLADLWFIRWIHGGFVIDHPFNEGVVTFHKRPTQTPGFNLLLQLEYGVVRRDYPIRPHGQWMLKFYSAGDGAWVHRGAVDHPGAFFHGPPPRMIERTRVEMLPEAKDALLKAARKNYSGGG